MMEVDEDMSILSKESSSKEKWMEDLDNLYIESSVMNKLVMDYLISEGFKEAAEKFEEEAGVSAGTSLESLDAKIKIRDAILEGAVQCGISLINDLHPELLDNNRTLLFYLQLQHLIELIRGQKTEEALDYAQNHLSERGEDSYECLSDLEGALALLAFDKPDESPFSDLLSSAQRHKVWSLVNSAISEHQNQPANPKLASVVNLLMWSQEQLDKHPKSPCYPKMVDLSTGKISTSDTNS